MDNIFQTSFKIWNQLYSHSLNQMCGCVLKCCIFILDTAAILNKTSLGGQRAWQRMLRADAATCWRLVELAR